MSFETDAFEKLDSELEEELTKRNFHLHEEKPKAAFERKIKPEPTWFAFKIAVEILASVIFGSIFYLLIDKILTLVEPAKFPNFFLKYASFINPIILALVALVTARIFLSRIISSLYAFFALKFSEFLITENYIFIKSKMGTQRGRLIPLNTIASVITRQNIIQRLFMVGDVIIQQKNGRPFFMHSIRDHEETAKDIIRLLEEVDRK